MQIQQRRSPCNCYPTSDYPLVSQARPKATQARIAFSITHGEEVRDTGPMRDILVNNFVDLRNLTSMI